mmetsp:Transcript_22126/g.40675  ORF Transcript_22126/g.40675 Transcript_22126/m.40675 type:complete len:363 (-) Transcript_22126:214-1302(-)
MAVALLVALTLAASTPLVEAVLPLGAACTTSIFMQGSPPEECEPGLECVLVDLGDEARDVPNAGFCFPVDTRLPIDHDCSASTLECATSLSCRPGRDGSEGTCLPCPCGSTCTMLGGSTGMCGEDGTCANFLVAPECQAVDEGIPLPASGPLELGDVCKSGGVETGPGVMREYDCPVGSVCLPQPDVFAIGGEVPHTCQSASAPLPANGICSPSGSLLFPAILCGEGLECIVIDAGRPELDVPSIGICMIAGSALPVGAECQGEEVRASGTTTPCAPKLHCAWILGAAPAPDVNGYRCQAVTSGDDILPPMMPPDQHDDDYLDGDLEDAIDDDEVKQPAASGATSLSSMTAFMLPVALYRLK